MLLDRIEIGGDLIFVQIFIWKRSDFIYDFYLLYSNIIILLLFLVELLRGIFSRNNIQKEIFPERVKYFLREVNFSLKKKK